jgi:hypothetical protein
MAAWWRCPSNYLFLRSIQIRIICHELVPPLTLVAGIPRTIRDNFFAPSTVNHFVVRGWIAIVIVIVVVVTVVVVVIIGVVVIVVVVIVIVVIVIVVVVTLVVVVPMVVVIVIVVIVAIVIAIVVTLIVVAVAAITCDLLLLHGVSGLEEVHVA